MVAPSAALPSESQSVNSRQIRANHRLWDRRTDQHIIEYTWVLLPAKEQRARRASRARRAEAEKTVGPYTKRLNPGILAATRKRATDS